MKRCTVEFGLLIGSPLGIMYSMTSDDQVYSLACLLVHPLVIWNLALIHLERYLSIVHPLRCIQYNRRDDPSNKCRLCLTGDGVVMAGV
jgi:hypothetical protein